MSEPLVIAHVTAPAPVGGLESVVRGLAAGFGSRGHAVHVIQVFDHGGAVTPIALDGLAGVTPHVLELPRRRYDRERAAVTALCRTFGAQIMHTHGYRSDVVDGLAAHRAGCRSVTTVHGFTGGGRVNRLYEKVQVWSYRRLDAVVAVSRKLHRDLAARGVPGDRLHTIPNAWPGAVAAPLERAAARRALGLPPDGKCIGWVGRFSLEKAPDILLEALALLAPGAWRAAFLGAGPMEPALREQAARLGLSDRVVWCGHVPDAARCYGAFDVFALSSRTEGTPIALLEALAARVPVVATRVGGVPDVVGEGEALLTQPEAPREFAQALDCCLADEAAAHRRAAAAHARFLADFTTGPWLDRYENLYRSLAGRGV